MNDRTNDRGKQKNNKAKVSSFAHNIQYTPTYVEAVTRFPILPIRDDTADIDTFFYGGGALNGNIAVNVNAENRKWTKRLVQLTS